MHVEEATEVERRNSPRALLMDLTAQGLGEAVGVSLMFPELPIEQRGWYLTKFHDVILGYLSLGASRNGKV